MFGEATGLDEHCMSLSTERHHSTFLVAQASPKGSQICLPPLPWLLSPPFPSGFCLGDESGAGSCPQGSMAPGPGKAAGALWRGYWFWQLNVRKSSSRYRWGFFPFYIELLSLGDFPELRILKVGKEGLSLFVLFCCSF